MRNLRRRKNVSLIVATRNRSEQLATLFASLRGQSHRQFSVIVVDQSDNLKASLTRRVCETYTSVFDIVYLRCDRTGLSVARNVGLARQQGDIVGFPDDDCWYDQWVLESVVRWFDDHPSYGFVQGAYTEPGLANPAFPNRPREITLWHPMAHSVGLFVRRAALERSNARFDESVGAGTLLPTSEELDLVLGLLEAGIKGRYDPKIIVNHRIKRGLGSEKQALAAIRARNYVYAKHVRAGAGQVVIQILARLLKYSARAAVSSRGRRELGAIIGGCGDAWHARGRIRVTSKAHQ
ncbi:glycosyltransferase family 2 protein [Limnochorda pilosa]|uniref:Glycosyl transferase n=1 Tax=Limnochorda pilosa TaxID=1555112 RepID=A0A0K2SLU8_LIMPI|nr:glycosyl transferase [Limnochorda pilosa]